MKVGQYGLQYPETLKEALEVAETSLKSLPAAKPAAEHIADLLKIIEKQDAEIKKLKAQAKCDYQAIYYREEVIIKRLEAELKSRGADVKPFNGRRYGKRKNNKSEKIDNGTDLSNLVNGVQSDDQLTSYIKKGFWHEMKRILGFK